LVDIDAIWDQLHTIITIFGFGQVQEPLRDRYLLEWQSPCRTNPIDGKIIENFMVLDKIDFGAFSGAECGYPLRGLPPRGNHHVAVGDIVVADRSTSIQDAMFETAAVKV